MKEEGRFVHLPHINVIAEVLQQQLYQAKVRYILGGFEWVEWVTSEDYRELDDFEYNEVKE